MRSAVAVTLAAWLVCATLVIASFVLRAAGARGVTFADLIGFSVEAMSFATAGALIVARRPGNAVGYLMLVNGFLIVSFLAGRSYVTYDMAIAPGLLPAVDLVAWWAASATTPTFLLLVMVLPLIYPTGRPPSRRWRPVLVGFVAFGAALTAANALSSGPLPNMHEVENPLAVAAADELWASLRAVAPVVIWLSIAASAASMAYRYRRADTTERLQLKWFVYALAIVVPISVVGGIWNTFFGEFAIMTLSAALVPLAISFAMLRYRLYDIDVLINRTLVYGAVIVLLAATYGGTILLLLAALRPLTSGSELSVAGSTLVIVALFQPVRGRVQLAVDRRFYRSRYDAARTLDAFGNRLRDEVDLDALRRELLGVVRDTMQPAQASVWLREERR